MTLKEIAEAEQQEAFYVKQIELRDKLIIRLLAETELLCEECALKTVCTDGAKTETCALGLLAARYKEINGQSPE